ncbi:hypothetical protein QC764_200850 [Podospora pseudoanserina]|uniref:Enoyl reductase (ER) domain-containing protein n=1 Tax=Podospora pseudoanserina TaxID=2609844 RepID=A0ABR0IFL4_9PEZI|nr:hypothetical protein QC764_200850 [Podospora pseudoanserina]
MPDLMKAVDIKNGKGPASALFINPSTPIPHPPAGHALVRIKAFGLNRMDLLQREGNYPLPPQAPSTLGVEFSGTIVSFGGDEPNQEHEHFKKGDEVFGLAYGGAYAEYISVSTRMLLHKPNWLSFEQAAGIPETWITALQALDFVLGAVESVGGEGDICYGWHGEKIKFIEGTLGAMKGFNYKSEDWVKGVLEATGGKGVDLIVDFVGGSYFEKNLDVVARDGRLVMLGLMGGMQTPDRVNIGKLLYKRVRVEGSTLRSRDEEYQGKLRDRLEQEYLPKFEKGELKVFVDRVLPWEEIQKGHEVLEGNETMGKVICTIS